MLQHVAPAARPQRRVTAAPVGGKSVNKLAYIVKFGTLDERRPAATDSPVVNSTRVRDGSTVITLGNSLIGLELWPERGAKVSSIIDHRTGRNWLSVTDRPWGDATAPRWEDSDRAGWDECLPNIAEGVHTTTQVELPDHGEVWRRPWTYDFLASGIRTRIQGVALSYELTRDILLSNETLLITYRLANLKDEELDIVWAMHLLADIKPSAVQLADDTPVRVDSTFGACGGVVAGQGWTSWSDLVAQLAKAQTGWACKIFTRPGGVTSVDGADEKGRLTISIGEHPAPLTFGLWLNAGGWPSHEPLHHVGIEAGFGDHDDLSRARESNSTLRVQPMQTATWSVSLQLSSPPPLVRTSQPGRGGA